jgi:serine/threonine protein kinase
VRTGDPERIGDYAVGARLGRGAMGAVYLGRSPGGRLVAVKVVRPELADDPQFRDRFRREVAIMRSVGGFWTAAVVDADPDAPLPWLATEYVPGPTLHEAVTAHGRLPEPALRRLIAGLAEALVAIHRTGLIHRDLKPSNVLLATDGPRLIDFGIAKALEGSALTATGFLVGTPGFLSPEQIEGATLTPASDVFALGAVLVYAATGEGPFGSGNAAALMYRVTHEPANVAGVPSALRALASRCLDLDAGKRPAPGEVLAEIGTPGTGEWLPEPVRTMIGAPTEITAASRPATRPYTRVADDPPPPADPPPENAPPAHGFSPRHDPAPGDGPPAEGNRAVFRTSRRSALVPGTAAALGALVCGAVAKAASGAGHHGAAFVVFLGFLVLAVSAARLLSRLIRPVRRVEVSREGITVGVGARNRQLAWSRLVRVRVVQHPRGPWLVVWLAEAASGTEDDSAVLGQRLPRDHGGYRIYPVGHEHRPNAREREIRELRAALHWYGRDSYDPTP